MKTLNFASLTSLALMSGALYADGGTIEMPADPTPVEMSGKPFNFPLNADQNWFTKASYLYWKTYQDDIDYGNRLTSKPPANSQFDMKLKPKKPGFDWNSGVRVGIGAYLPEHDLWDFSFFFTYLYADAPDKSTPSPDQGSILTQQLEPDNIDRGADKARAHWKMNFFIGDLALGRQFTLIPTIVIRPFLGVRGVMIDQDYSCRYHRLSITNNGGVPFTELFRQKFKSTNDYSGIGPRIGADFSYFISKHWTFLVNFSSSLFIGSYKVREKILALKFQDGLLDQDSSYRFKDRGFTIRSNIEGYLGIGWEQWTNNQTVRFAPSLLFEASEWFDVNQLSRIPGAASYNLADTFPFQQASRLHGDLGFLGLTLNLQMDF